MHTIFESAVLAVTAVGSLGLAFIAQKTALAYLLKAIALNHMDNDEGR